MTVVEAEADSATETEKSTPCPACGGSDVRVFYRVENVPTNSCILLDTEAEAKAYPTGRIALGVCSGCGFMFNTAFVPELAEYSGRYEETQSFSPTFNRFHKQMAERLIEQYGLRSKTVLEIGCGKGEFLMLLAELGDITGIGIDPGVKPDRISGPAAERMTFIPDFYSEKYGHHEVDFLACKMTLEHIPDVANFLKTVRRGLGDQLDTIVFFQVPEALRILRDCAFEDIYYEHCSYFTPASLARVFRLAGFDVINTTIEYDDQYLTIEARPRAEGQPAQEPNENEDSLAEVLSLVASFEERTVALMERLQDRVRGTVADGKTVALWGSGSKAVSFMTSCDLADCVSAVTDVNPYRHGRFIPKTGHRIVAPDELKTVKPDLVVIMNRIYEPEIREDLARLGLHPEIVAL